MYDAGYWTDSTGCVRVLQKAQEYVRRARAHGALGSAMSYLTTKKSFCINGLVTAALALHLCSLMCFIFKGESEGKVVPILVKICF